MMNFKRKKLAKALLAVWVAFSAMTAPSVAMAGWLGSFDALKYNDECKSLNTFAKETKANRWWDKPFDVVADASIEFGSQTFTAVAGGAKKLLATGLAVWLVVFSMKAIGSMTESDPMDNLTKIGGQMFKGAFAMVMLGAGGATFFSYIVSPIIDLGVGMAGMGSVDAGSVAGLFEVKAPLKALVEKGHVGLSQTEAKGEFLECLSKIYKIKILGQELPLLPDPMAFTSGCIVSWAAFILKVAFPILIFNALMRLGITAALSPMFIVAWVFQATRSYTTKGFNSFLNVSLMFVCINFILSLACKLLEKGSGLEMLTNSEDTWTKTVCLMKLGGASKGDDNCSAYADMSSGAVNLFILLAIVFYCFLFLKEATTFSNYFSDTSFTNDTAFQAAKGAAGTAQKAVGAASLGAKAATSAVAWGSDKISQGRDRKAARTVEAARQNGGSAKTMSYKQQTQYAKSLDRLKRRGYINRDGSENAAYGDLLKNGKRRTAVNIASRIFTGGKKVAYKNKDYKNWGGKREKDDVDKLLR